jgi:hypothetical protein
VTSTFIDADLKTRILIISSFMIITISSIIPWRGDPCRNRGNSDPSDARTGTLDPSCGKRRNTHIGHMLGVPVNDDTMERGIEEAQKRQKRNPRSK